MEVSRKGLVIIGIVTVAIISAILFLTDMYITKLDEQARADMFDENLTMTDSDLFTTAPSELTQEQIDRLHELANTTSTDPADVDLARRANAMLMRTMSEEDAIAYGSEWEQKRLVPLEEAGGFERAKDYVPETILDDEPAPEEFQAHRNEEPVEEGKNKDNVYKSLSDGEYHDSSLDDKVVTLEELMSEYGVSEEDLVSIPER